MLPLVQTPQRVAMLVLATLSGCIVIPVPHPEKTLDETRPPITPARTASLLRPGQTTRADVLLAFGDPDLWWHDECTLAYGWTTSSLLVVSGYLVPGGLNGDVTDVPVNSYLVLEFDPDDRLTRHRHHTVPLMQSRASFVTDYLLPGREARP